MNWERLALIGIVCFVLGVVVGLVADRWIGPTPLPSPTYPLPPVTSSPSDPLLASLQAAYNAETAQDKAQKTGVLASVMEEAAKQATLKNASGNYVITSNKQLLDAVHIVTEQKVGSGQIPKVRAAVGDYLNSVLPRQEAPMTDETRAKATTAYTNAANTLKKVK